jgi:hypothetical protein
MVRALSTWAPSGETFKDEIRLIEAASGRARQGLLASQCAAPGTTLPGLVADDYDEILLRKFPLRGAR